MWVCPREHWLADVNAGEDFLTSLTEWEIKVAAYEVASGVKISEAMRVVTIMDHAPDAVKSVLRLSPLEQRRNVDALTLWIRGSSCAAPGLFQGSVPMQVGAVNDGDKSTGDKGKGKGTRAVTAARARNETFGTVVNNKYKSKVFVHIARSGDTNSQIVELGWHNRRKVQQWLGSLSLNLKLRMSKQHNGVTSTVKTWTWPRRVGAFAAMNTPRGPAGTLLVDSGADDHICHPDFAKESPLKKSVKLTLADLQGNPLSHHGTRHVNLRVGTQGQRANIVFQIAAISDNILSLGKLLRNRFVFSLKEENDSIMVHQNDPTTTVPLFLHRTSLRIRANRTVRHVSPVVEDDMPLRLSSRSPLKLLTVLWMSWHYLKQGTKLDTWTRLRETRVRAGTRAKIAGGD